MKKRKILIRLVPLLLIITSSGLVKAQEQNPCLAGGQTCYFGIEINEVLCGYSTETCCSGTLDGKLVRYELSDVILKMSALGADVDGGFRILCAYDPYTQKALKIDVSVINGASVVKTITRIGNDTAFFSSPTSGVSKVIPFGRDVIFGSQTWYPHLYIDFIKNGIREKSYKVYDIIKGEITEKGYSRLSEENIVLSDSLFQALVLEENDFATGIKTLLWINKADGHNVKAVVAGTRNIYLADKTVIDRTKFANIDNELFAMTDIKIPDIMNLTRLKVRAKVNSYGEELSVNSLNIPGQKFDGTVTGTLIDGVFEIEPARYNGSNAPLFPPDFGKYPELNKYIEPELMIEADNPAIRSEAIRITNGSKDSWEATVRLAKWVAENIAGVIPGGISAINTLKTREAECGGHSRLLAAFCRSMGIPARVVAGCMYTAYYSGGFGQHAWTEVYMGGNGWIPVDATINEPDYIDAGHIRFGENATFRPVSMEILSFKLGSETTVAGVDDKLNQILGSFMNLEFYRLFRIIERNGGLAIDIPGRVVLDLNPPDEQGRWYPKMTREISLVPEMSTDNRVDKIVMHQYFRLRKSAISDSAETDKNGEFRKFAGNYQFSPAKLSMDITFEDGTLITVDPLRRSGIMLTCTGNGDIWTDKAGMLEIGFVSGGEEEVSGLNLTIRLEFQRGSPVTDAISPVIKVSGIDAGIKRYDELKKSGNKEYLYSEHMLHQLGHQLLNEGKTDDAIKIFAKNVKEYPGSFLANDALAETYLKNGESKMALKYFRAAVKLNPEYKYGKEKIGEIKHK
jgi:hypothetical protein